MGKLTVGCLTGFPRLSETVCLTDIFQQNKHCKKRRKGKVSPANSRSLERYLGYFKIFLLVFRLYVFQEFRKKVLNLQKKKLQMSAAFLVCSAQFMFCFDFWEDEAYCNTICFKALKSLFEYSNIAQSFSLTIIKKGCNFFLLR